MDKLAFLTPGIPYSTKPKKTMENALLRIKELGLDGMELEYTRGVIVDYPKLASLGSSAKSLGLTLTAHAPYFINFYSQEKEKVDKSYRYVLDTARLLDAANGYSVVFHAAYYMGSKPQEVYPAIKSHMKNLLSIAKKEALKLYIRPELMGKPSQFGSLDEVVQLAADVGGQMLPCVDFAHLHARTGKYNTYEEFTQVLEKIESALGEEAIQNMHIHVSGIQYSQKGEQRHLIFRDSDFRMREFLKALKDYGVCGTLVCESPNIEGDTLMLKQIYQAM